MNKEPLESLMEHLSVVEDENDAVKGEVKGVLESTLETNPRVPEDSILGMAITMKRLSEEIKNGKA